MYKPTIYCSTDAYCLFILQVPSLLDWLSTFYRCSSGIKYALLVVVPSFYLFSSLLFLLLGVVTVRWERRGDRVGRYAVPDTQPTTEDSGNGKK